MSSLDRISASFCADEPATEVDTKPRWTPVLELAWVFACSVKRSATAYTPYRLGMAWSSASTMESAAATFVARIEAKNITEANTRFRLVGLAWLEGLLPIPWQIWLLIEHSEDFGGVSRS